MSILASAFFKFELVQQMPNRSMDALETYSPKLAPTPIILIQYSIAGSRPLDRQAGLLFKLVLTNHSNCRTLPLLYYQNPNGHSMTSLRTPGSFLW
jgi:hypothetical protein